MTSNIGHFETLQSNNGTVKVGGDHLLSFEGKGTCILHPSLPDGSSTSIRLRNVLYVPSLKHDLLSWNSLRSSFTCEMSGKDVFVKRNDECILWGEFYQNLPFLNESSEFAYTVTAVKQPKSAATTSNAKIQPNAKLTRVISNSSSIITPNSSIKPSSKTTPNSSTI